MRIDVITIFPEYLSPLELSLIGKARRDGLLSLHVHDLRTFTHDRHRTVDDTPVGGGAGMVMKPEPWAAAISHVLAEGRTELSAGGDGSEDSGLDPGGAEGAREPSPLVILPNPAGEPMTQAIAQETSTEPWIVFACGRYEGIDERVYELLADRGVRTRLLSLGDYVLNGGEVAVLAITEAVVRLIPGVLGNPASIVEESHSQGLLEYPIYTKPATWTDPDGVERTVPEVLLSGDHGRIARWRREQSLERTRARRPDLLDGAAALERDADDRRPSA